MEIEAAGKASGTGKAAGTYLSSQCFLVCSINHKIKGVLSMMKTIVGRTFFDFSNYYAF